MIQRTSEAMGNVLIVVVFVASVIAIIGALVERDRHRHAPATHFITESDPEWVPRLPGSLNTPIVVGQCGQWDGRYWHRVECPRVDR